MTKRLTNSEFENRVNSKQGNRFEIISDYHSMHSKIKIKCNKCGWIGEVEAGNLIHQNYGSRCPIHGNEANAKNFLHKVRQKYGDRFKVLSDYKGSKSKIKVKDGKNGKKFNVLANSLLHGRISENYKHAVRLNFKQASKRLSEISNGEIKLIHFSGMAFVAAFKCCKCENVWRTTASNVFDQLTGCPACSSSKGEKAVTEYLKKKGYHFEPQFRIETCKDKKPLPFDFAVFNRDRSLNSLIEYQGRQHFTYPSQYKKKGPFNKESVLRTQKHDEMKSSFCEKNGIKLICIDHPQTTFESNKHSFIANLVKQTLDKELKVN